MRKSLLCAFKRRAARFAGSQVYPEPYATIEGTLIDSSLLSRREQIRSSVTPVRSLEDSRRKDDHYSGRSMYLQARGVPALLEALR